MQVLLFSFFYHIFRSWLGNSVSLELNVNSLIPTGYDITSVRKLMQVRWRGTV